MNSNRTSVQQQQHGRGGGLLKGLLARPSSAESEYSHVSSLSGDVSQHRGIVNNGARVGAAAAVGGVSASHKKATGSLPPLHAQHETNGQGSTNEFLPNPTIPASPANTPPKKIWEGAFRKARKSTKGSTSPGNNSPLTSSDDGSSAAVAAMAASGKGSPDMQKNSSYLLLRAVRD